MGLDLVTYLRTEFVSAALVSNQIPRVADVCLEIGTADGRAASFIPKTLRELRTSSAELDGKLLISVKRQLKQQQERRGSGAKVIYLDQPADNLVETADESVDVVISLQAAAVMKENGLDWKKSIREAGRVLKPGGRFLFVEQTELDGESYLGEVLNTPGRLLPQEEAVEGTDEEDERAKMFDMLGYDEVDLVVEPHIAGVAVKSEDAGLSEKEITRKASKAEKDRIADLGITAYERGIKKRKRKKKKNQKEDSGMPQ